MTKSKRSILFYAIIFLSGFTFLVYEVSWFRMLALVTGATVSATTLVLVAFMGGFGIGAWYWGRRNAEKYNPYWILIIQLAGIGTIGAISHLLFSAGIPALYSLFTGIGFALETTGPLVFACTLLLLFIPSFFMGGILPVLSGMAIKNDDEFSGILGSIYSWETLGSTLGGLAAGTLLIKLMGQQNTIFLAVLLNILSLLLLLLVKKSLQIDETQPSSLAAEKPIKGKMPRGKETGWDASQNRFAVLVSTFIFGFTVIGLQVAWFRIFRIYLTNTSYTFALISSMVILGLFAGSRLFASKVKKNVQIGTLVKLLLFAAVFVVIGFGILMKIPEWIMFPLAGEQDAYVMRVIIIPIISAILVILPVTFISGYAFPLACRLYSANFREASNSIGHVLLINTAGSVTGPLLTAFLLIPLLGSGFAVLSYAVIMLLAAYLIARRQESGSWKNMKIIPIVAGGFLLLILMISPRPKVLPPSFVRYDRKILEYRETVEGTWVIGQEPGGRGAAISTYVNNSAVIGSSYDAIKVVKMVGHLPFYAGLTCKDALVVGFGIGVTTSAIASHREVERIDCVELVAGLVDAAHYYSGLNANIQNDPRLKVRSGDGRQFLQVTDRKYDLISTDPTHPILGSGSLYTREYFELCRKRLNPGGMVSQYLPLHKLLLEDLLGIIKTFHSVFPNATVWLGQNHAVLLGSDRPLSIDFNKWSDKISSMEKDPYFYNNPYHLASCLAFDAESIANLPGSIPLNTDNHPVTEFFKLSSLSGNNLAINLAFMNQNRSVVDRTFQALPDKATMDRFIADNKLMTEGIIFNLSGNRRGFLDKLRDASALNPENEELPYLYEFYSRN